MFQKTYGVWTWMIILLMFAGCAGKQQSLEKDTPEKSAESTGEKVSGYPVWYQGKEQVASDSANFYGYGMAVANDSAESIRQALNYAQSDLRRAVDDSLEKVRVKLINKNESSYEELDTPTFIMALRNSVSFVDDKAIVGQQNVRKQSSRWVSYVKTRISFQTVTQAVKSPLSNYPAFYRALE